MTFDWNEQQQDVGHLLELTRPGLHGKICRLSHCDAMAMGKMQW